jgi:SET domain-containing protein
MRYEACTESDTLKYFAVREIQEGEELTVNYNSGLGSHISESDDWFDKHNIKPMEDAS